VVTAPLAILAVVVMACSVGTGGTAGTGIGPTATPTITPTPVPSCTALLPGSVAASAGAGVPGVSFPASAVMSQPPTTVGGGAGQFSVKDFDVCAPSTTAAAVTSFYATGLPAGGWATSTEFPYDGQLHKTCTDTCWSRDNTIRKVTIENVQNKPGGLVTYHMRLAAPPPLPACAGGTPTFVTSVPGQADIPLPPLTSVLSSFGPSGDAKFSGQMCSAGTGASVKAFSTPRCPARAGLFRQPTACAAPTIQTPSAGIRALSGCSSSILGPIPAQGIAGPHSIAAPDCGT
jgi:hypothetical protein